MSEDSAARGSRRAWIIGLAAGAVVVLAVGIGVAVTVTGSADASPSPSPSAFVSSAAPSPSPSLSPSPEPIDEGCPVVSPGVTIFDPHTISALSAEPHFSELFRIPAPPGAAHSVALEVRAAQGAPTLFSFSTPEQWSAVAATDDAGRLLWHEDATSWLNGAHILGTFDSVPIGLRTVHEVGERIESTTVTTVDLRTGAELARLDGAVYLWVPPGSLRGHYDAEFNPTMLSRGESVMLFSPAMDGEQGSVSAYDPFTLDPQWSTPVDAEAPYEGVIVTAVGDRVVVRSDGALVLSERDGSRIDAIRPRPAAVSGGRLVGFDSVDGVSTVSGIDPRTGEACWSVPGGSALQVEDGVMVRGVDEILRKIDVADGTTIAEWGPVPEGSAGRMVGEYYLFPRYDSASASSGLYVARPGEQARLIGANLDGAMLGYPLAYDGETVVVHGGLGAIVGLGLADGEVRWRLEGVGPVSAAGAVYRAAVDGDEIVVSVLE